MGENIKWSFIHKALFSRVFIRYEILWCCFNWVISQKFAAAYLNLSMHQENIENKGCTCRYKIENGNKLEPIEEVIIEVYAFYLIHMLI